MSGADDAPYAATLIVAEPGLKRTISAEYARTKRK
jgi:hypothetical protein